MASSIQVFEIGKGEEGRGSEWIQLQTIIDIAQSKHQSNAITESIDRPIKPADIPEDASAFTRSTYDASMVNYNKLLDNYKEINQKLANEFYPHIGAKLRLVGLPIGQTSPPPLETVNGLYVRLRTNATGLRPNEGEVLVRGIEALTYNSSLTDSEQGRLLFTKFNMARTLGIVLTETRKLEIFINFFATKPGFMADYRFYCLANPVVENRTAMALFTEMENLERSTQFIGIGGGTKSNISAHQASTNAVTNGAGGGHANTTDSAKMKALQEENARLKAQIAQGGGGNPFWCSQHKWNKTHTDAFCKSVHPTTNGTKSNKELTDLSIASLPGYTP